MQIEIGILALAVVGMGYWNYRVTRDCGKLRRQVGVFIKNVDIMRRRTSRHVSLTLE